MQTISAVIVSCDFQYIVSRLGPLPLKNRKQAIIFAISRVLWANQHKTTIAVFQGGKALHIIRVTCLASLSKGNDFLDWLCCSCKNWLDMMDCNLL